MALTKSGSARVVQSSATNTAGSTTTTSGQTVGYGASGVAKITNGSTAPTLPCQVYMDFSADNSTFYNGPSIGSADTVASSVTLIPYAIGIGTGGDWAYYRLRFTGNTGQSVTVEAEDSSTSGV